MACRMWRHQQQHSVRINHDKSNRNTNGVARAAAAQVTTHSHYCTVVIHMQWFSAWAAKRCVWFKQMEGFSRLKLSSWRKLPKFKLFKAIFHSRNKFAVLQLVQRNSVLLPIRSYFKTRCQLTSDTSAAGMDTSRTPDTSRLSTLSTWTLCPQGNCKTKWLSAACSCMMAGACGLSSQ